VKYRIEYVSIPDPDGTDWTEGEYLDLAGRRIVAVLGEHKTQDTTVLLRVLTEETGQ
jgi:hypothetical protein